MPLEGKHANNTNFRKGEKVTTAAMEREGCHFRRQQGRGCITKPETPLDVDLFAITTFLRINFPYTGGGAL